MDRWEVGTEMIGETTEASLNESLELFREFHGKGGGRLRYAFCPRGSRNCTEPLWHDLAAIATEKETLLHSHALENEAQTRRLEREGGTDVVYLNRLGATGPHLVLAHCVWASPAEIDLLAQTDTRVAHCPSANMKLASGFAPVPEFLEHGVKVGLGADGAPCNNNLDMFTEMRLAGTDSQTALRTAQYERAPGSRNGDHWRRTGTQPRPRDWISRSGQARGCDCVETRGLARATRVRR